MYYSSGAVPVQELPLLLLLLVGVALLMLLVLQCTTSPPHHRNGGNADPTYNFGCQIDDVRCKDAIPYGSGRTLLAFALVYFHIHVYSGIVLWKANMAFGNDPIFKRKYIYGCCAPSSLYCFQRQISTNTWESGTINSIWTTDMVVLCFHSIQSFWSLCRPILWFLSVLCIRSIDVSEQLALRNS